jgi:hypothetical protein
VLHRVPRIGDLLLATVVVVLAIAAGHRLSNAFARHDHAVAEQRLFDRFVGARVPRFGLPGGFGDVVYRTVPGYTLACSNHHGPMRRLRFVMCVRMIPGPRGLRAANATVVRRGPHQTPLGAEW